MITLIFHRTTDSTDFTDELLMRKRMNSADWLTQDIFGPKSIENLT